MFVDVAIAHQPSSQDLEPNSTQPDHLSRDTIQVVQSFDEDMATKPLSSSPRMSLVSNPPKNKMLTCEKSVGIQQHMPSDDDMSACTSVHSTSVVICTSQSIADVKDGVHKPAVLDSQNSSEPPFISGMFFVFRCVQPL